MPRPPSKHGLERKYKPWRRGMGGSSTTSHGSSKAGKGKGGGRPRSRSLKNQLRGQRRFLSKLMEKDKVEMKSAKGKNATDEQQQEQEQERAKRKTMIEGVEQRIRDIECAIEEKAKTEQEKKFAAKYHMVKFIERQRLSRMERRALKNLAEAKAATDFDDVSKYSAELQAIALDQLYVAHFPNHLKYMSLFGKDGVRIVDNDEKNRKRREKIRMEIWDRVRSGDIGGDDGDGVTKGWVNMKFLDLGKERPTLIEDNNEIVTMDAENNKENDNEGNKQQQSRNLLNHENKNISFETKQNRNDVPNVNAPDTSDSSSSSSTPSECSSDEDDADATIKDKRNYVTAAGISKNDLKENNMFNGDLGNTLKPRSSYNDSGGFEKAPDKNTNRSGVNNEATEKQKYFDKKTLTDARGESSSKNENDSSESDSSESDSSESDIDSSSDSDNGNGDNEMKDNNRYTSSLRKKDELGQPSDAAEDNEESEIDDFLVDNEEDEDIMKPFAKATSNNSELSYAGKRRGDKSKGWQTQRQKPGEWKRPRRRV